MSLSKRIEIGAIPKDWEIKRIGDICEVTSSNRIFVADYVKRGVPFFRSKEIIEKAQNKTISTELFISEKKFGEIKEKYGVPKTGDVLLTAVGARSGIPYYVADKSEFYFKDGNLIWLKNFNNTVFSKYLFYYLRSDIGQHYLNIQMIGSAQPALTIDGLKQLLIKFPPLREQFTIARILSIIDEKIILNYQMNQTLEAICQALFKHWFVDFEFPNEEDKSYKSSGGKMVFNQEIGKEIPKGWRLTELRNFGKIVCGKTPPKSNKKFFGGDVPFIKIPDMHNHLFIIDTEDTLTDDGKNFQANKSIPPNSICISCIATIGLVSITTEESQTNQQINCIIPHEEFYLPYLLYTTKSLKRELEELGSGGSATLNVNTNTFSNIKIINPKADVVKEFHRKTMSLLYKVRANLIGNRTLSQIRDFLLPKLMSGKIRVPVPNDNVEAM